MSLGQKNQFVSETELGVGGTAAWKIAGVYPNTTLAVFFDIVNQVIIVTMILSCRLTHFISFI